MQDIIRTSAIPRESQSILDLRSHFLLKLILLMTIAENLFSFSRAEVPLTTDQSLKNLPPTDTIIFTSLSPTPPYENTLPFKLQSSFFNCSQHFLSRAQRKSLEQDYTISGNVPFECAEVVLLGENHSDPRTNKKQRKHWKKLKAGHLLLEGYPLLEAVTPCPPWDGDGVTKEKSTSLDCRGWDDLSLIDKSQEYSNQAYEKLYKKYDEIFSEALYASIRRNKKRAEANIKELNAYLIKTLGERSSFLINIHGKNVNLNELINQAKNREQFIEFSSKTLLLGNKFHVWEYNRVLTDGGKEINRVFDNLLGPENIDGYFKDSQSAIDAAGERYAKERNRSLIKALEAQKCKKEKCERTVARMGYNHIPEHHQQESTGEFQEFLSHIPHATLMPKW